MLDILSQDLRYSARMLRRQPGFSLVAVLTIALGISATTVVFSLISTLVLQPLPVADPDRLAVVQESRSGRVHVHNGVPSFSFERYTAFREASGHVFSGLAAHRYSEGSLRVDGQAEVVSTVRASANYFEVLGVRPVLGGAFPIGADRAEEPVAVISHEMWSGRFGRDPGVIGRTLHLDTRAYTVVGVAPEGFVGTVAVLPVDVWVPAPSDAGELILFGRLRDGITPQAATAALAVVSQQVALDHADARVRGISLPPLTGLPGDARGAVIGFMAMLLATAGLVLLIASANVGGMLLARASSRRREIAVRLAVGAGRRRLIRQLVTESVTLFLLGGAAAVALTFWATRLLSAYQPPVPVRVALDVGVDVRVLGFACAVALLTGLAFGLAPALQATRLHVAPALRDGAHGGSARTRLRSGFVVAQVALSLLLLVTAGLFVRTLQAALGAEIGFNPAGVAVAGINLNRHGYDPERGAALQAQLVERVRALPGVAGVAYAIWAPMSGNAWSGSAQLPGPVDDGERVPTNLGIVDGPYFEVLQIPLAAGRVFDARDGAGSAPTAIVNEALARRLWPGESPLGRRVRIDDIEREVVGVARDGKYETYTESPRNFAYLPLAEEYRGSLTLHVRSHTDAGAAETLAGVRRELAALDANIALEGARPLASLIGLSIMPQRLAAAAIGAFGLAGLMLVAIGLYGILAYQVAMRTREIGIRMAIGARRADVVRQVLRQSSRLVALGTLLGLGAAFAATRLLASLLYGVSATDPVTFVVVPLLLALVALLASWLPARRAARVDPVVALRAE